jgi:hypothetical protein
LCIYTTTLYVYVRSYLLADLPIGIAMLSKL